MGGQRLVDEEFDDGLGGEVGSLDAFENNAGNGALAEGNEDDVAGLEVVEALGGGVSQNAASAVAEDFSGNYLEKHKSII